MPSPVFAQEWLELRNSLGNLKFALTAHERLRCICIVNAVIASCFGLAAQDFEVVLENCDLPQNQLTGASAKQLNPKGFWRIDKNLDPELRHTVLSLVAFHDLQAQGLDAFLAQNDGEGWLIPERLRLADSGLGHDARAQEFQPVAERLGPRFLDWQLGEDVARSWQECAAHAALIRRIVPPPEDAASADDDFALQAQPAQTEMF